MGYYDEPNTYDLTVSFTCKSCGHENIDMEVASTSRWNVNVECENCDFDSELNLEDESCRCPEERCVC